jgi:type III secretion protein T
MGAFSLGGPYDSLSAYALLLGLSTTRVAVAFLLLPLMSPEVVPATVRNALFVAMALFVLVLQPAPDTSAWSGLDWALTFAKEAFVGGALGFFFGGMLWAFEAAGQVIDSKAGTSLAQVLDPLSGHQTSLTGAYLGRLASWVFMAGGGFLLMLRTLVDSYALWPLDMRWPPLQAKGASLFEAEFGRIMRLMLLVAAPCLALLYVVEGVLGLVNRFAQQLNVFALSLSLKAVLAYWVLWIQVAQLVHLLQDELMRRPQVVVEMLKALVKSN